MDFVPPATQPKLWLIGGWQVISDSRLQLLAMAVLDRSGTVARAFAEFISKLRRLFIIIVILTGGLKYPVDFLLESLPAMKKVN